MSCIDKAETLAIAAAVLFSVLFFALVAYLGISRWRSLHVKPHELGDSTGIV